MKNLGGFLKQAQQMQSKIAEVQNKLDSLEVEGSSGNGLIRVITSGKGEVKRFHIDPSALGDVEMLEDLLVAACRDAKSNADELSSAEMKKITGGMPLPPGMKLPF